VAALILTGKEAAASGRARDAEVSFLNACRNAQVLQGGDAAMNLADAMYQLGRHYANVAQASGVHKGELLARSQRLYQAALQTYQARYGAKGEKTRFAQEGLAKVQRLADGTALPPPPVTAAAAPSRSPAPAAPTHPAAEAAPAPRPTAKAAPAPEPRAVQQAETKPQSQSRAESRPAAVAPDTTTAASRVRTQPSFDCARARSVPEKIVCGDEELARQDRELGRLHARAEAAAADRAAFRRQNDAEWRRREDNCRDRDCVRRWYAERRAQLEAAQPHAEATQPTIQTRPAPPVEARPAPARSERSRAAPRFEQPRDAQPAPGTASGEPAQAEGSPNAPP
jgi:hypothetical protein